MVEVQMVRESDLPEFRCLHNAYVDRDASLETVRDWYQEHPELLIGAYDDGELAGHCLGLPRAEGEVELAGIAVEQSHQRQGIGSALLSAFEEQARSLQFQRISLGSAGGYVDEFYIENGYTPHSVLVRLDPDDVPQNYRDMEYKIADERMDGCTKKLYVEVDGFDPAFVEEIRAAFDDSEAVYIMEKDLDTS